MAGIGSRDIEEARNRECAQSCGVVPIVRIAAWKAVEIEVLGYGNKETLRLRVQRGRLKIAGGYVVVGWLVLKCWVALGDVLGPK